MEGLLIFVSTFIMIKAFLEAGCALGKDPKPGWVFFMWVLLGAANLVLLTSVQESRVLKVYKASQQQEQILEKEGMN